MRVTLPFLLALAAVVQAQQASSGDAEPNLMDMILAPITSNIKHAIPVNTIPAELVAPDTNTTSTNTTEEAAPVAEAATAPIQEDSAPEVAQDVLVEPEKEVEGAAVATESDTPATEAVPEPVAEAEVAVEGDDKPAEKRSLNKPPGIIVNVDTGSHRRRSVKAGNSSHSNAKMVKRVHKAAGIERKYGAGGK